jgi:molybdopterin converting factor subunit 1
MKVTVLYFAQVQETVGISEEKWEIEGTLEDLLKQILAKHNNLSDIIPKMINHTSEVALAVNAQLISNYSCSIQENDEIAFIPPISGG